MPRTYNKKGVHTSPEKAGKQNLEPILDTLPKDEDNIGKKVNSVYKKGIENYAHYHGQWTDDELRTSIAEFFDYCAEIQLKPTQPLLRLWLKTNADTLIEWRRKPEKYGVKSEIIKDAFEYLEACLQANIEKYPTGNIFLLKTSYGHVEASKIDITTNGQSINNPEDMDDVIKKLGLDQEK